MGTEERKSAATTASINRLMRIIGRFGRAGAMADGGREREREGGRDVHTQAPRQRLSSVFYEEWHIPHAEHKRITGGEAGKQTERAEAKVQTSE